MRTKETVYAHFTRKPWRSKMTDFGEASKRKCHTCGQKYYPQEGKMCDCWRCANCGEEFSDFDCLANRELWLCHYCEDVRAQKEGALSVVL